MIEYHKIEGLYARDMEGTKQLIEGVFRNPAVEFLKDNTWQFTEKIDGTNISVCWDGHAVTFNGRTEKAQIPAHLVNFLTATFGTSEAEQIFEEKFGETPVILFGEGYGPKIQSGGAYRPDVSFILFDVNVGGVWLSRENVESVARYFGIDVVPVILRGTMQEAIEYVKARPASTIGTAKMEGLVGRPALELLTANSNRLIVKVKVRDFEELEKQGGKGK
jgi:hypothetical protein